MLYGQFLSRAGIDCFVAAVVVHQEYAQVGQVVHIEEFAQRASVSPAGHEGQALHFGFMEAPYQGGQYVAVRGVVVVVGAIQVGGHHADVVRSVLPVQELAIFQSRDFGQRIRLVGFLQFRGQQAAFLHGLGSHARVDT